MAFKQAKQRGSVATQFICDRLEDSRLYQIQSKDHLQLTCSQRADKFDSPKTIQILMANIAGQNSYENASLNNRNKGIFTAPILYKDPQSRSAYVLLTESGDTRDLESLNRKSLKDYGLEQIQGMVQLRKIEKTLIEKVGNSLFYFFPETTNEEAVLNQIKFQGVTANYSHIHPDKRHPSWTKYKKLTDVKIPVITDKVTATDAAKLVNPQHSRIPLIATLSPTPVVYEINQEGQYLMFG